MATPFDMSKTITVVPPGFSLNLNNSLIAVEEDKESYNSAKRGSMNKDGLKAVNKSADHPSNSAAEDEDNLNVTKETTVKDNRSVSSDGRLSFNTLSSLKTVQRVT